MAVEGEVVLLMLTAAYTRGIPPAPRGLGDALPYPDWGKMSKHPQLQRRDMGQFTGKCPRFPPQCTCDLCGKLSHVGQRDDLSSFS